MATDSTDAVMDLEKLTKSSSVSSVDSTVSAASFTSEDLNVEEEYEAAPWALFGEHEGLGGKIRIAKQGDMLPILTGYKTKKDGNAEVGVQFK